tara:strand:+ start:4190 stop:4591 length:402 start_codon:yes stop_codon:yes gene_type:complete
MPKVLVTGTFDGIHPGHLNLFKQAKKYGDLIILVARDETVKEIKGRYPKQTEVQRLARLTEINLAKHVVLGNLKDKYQVLEDWNPDFICVGYDQSAFLDKLKDEIKKRKLNTRIIKLKAFKPEKYKSSMINGD